VPSSVGSGAVNGYRVRWCKGSTCAAWVNLPASARAATATGRVKNTTYRVEVQAKNASGLGPVASKAFKQGK
jgi:Fibronectin type III domain